MSHRGMVIKQLLRATRNRWSKGFYIFIACLPCFSCYQHAVVSENGVMESKMDMQFVTVPEGTFTRGDLNGDPDEYPESQITLKSFRIGRMEVSNLQYDECVMAKVCDPSLHAEDSKFNQPNLPVVGVTWFDAKRFCDWKNARLPTEAEWEYAARGKDLRKWTWHGAFKKKAANIRGSQDGFEHTAPVESFTASASPFGALNMSGNVAEWVEDFYDPTYYRTSTELDSPKGPKMGRDRTVRGGSFNDLSFSVRVTVRRPKRPTEASNSLGFRCVAKN